jgi:asparagine synthase (glutamine-hydrolysing)
MFRDSIDNIWQAMDQPTIDGVNSYFVSMAAHNAGLKAVLSGLGADELFGGYASSSREKWLPYLRSLPARDLTAAVAGKFNNAYRRLSFLRLNNTMGDYLFLRGIHAPSAIARVLQCDESEVWDQLKSVEAPAVSEISKQSYANFLEYNVYMKGQLLKDTDFMSMWFGLEARVPFLDQELVQVAGTTSIPANVRQQQPKYLLTKAFEDTLPNEIVFRKKHGFTFPFHLWLRNSIEKKNGLVESRSLAQLPVREFMNGKAHWSQVWSGVVLDRFRWK